MEYRDSKGRGKSLGAFGKSTRREFDDALSALPELIRSARSGNEQDGIAANDMLWALANESVNTRETCPDTFKTLFNFGKPEGIAAPPSDGAAEDDGTEPPKHRYLVVSWYDDDDGEGEEVVGEIRAYTEAHARLLLRNGINGNKYPSGAWTELCEEAAA